MKIVIVNGSARKGNTLAAIEAFTEGAKSNHQIEIIQADNWIFRTGSIFNHTVYYDCNRKNTSSKMDMYIQYIATDDCFASYKASCKRKYCRCSNVLRSVFLSLKG